MVRSLLLIAAYAAGFVAMTVGFANSSPAVGFTGVAVLVASVAGWFGRHRHYYEKRDQSLVPVDLQEAIRNVDWVGNYEVFPCGQCIRCNRWFQKGEVYHEAGETRVYWFDLEQRRDRELKRAMKARRRRDKYAAEGGHPPIEDLRQSRDSVAHHP